VSILFETRPSRPPRAAEILVAARGGVVWYTARVYALAATDQRQRARATGGITTSNRTCMHMHARDVFGSRDAQHQVLRPVPPV
jgi:hypothetical protein